MYRSNINLNLYKNFFEVAKTGSISAASKVLFVSQPAVSRAIKKLEEELHTKLFYRDLNRNDFDRAREKFIILYRRSI